MTTEAEDVQEQEASKGVAEKQEPPKARKQRKKTYREVDPDEDLPADVEVEEGSPIEADAEASSVLVEVTRVGGGSGPGWDGDTFDGAPVSKGRVGSFPQSRDIYDRVQALAGAGRFNFVGKHKNGKTFNYDKVLPGTPKSLPAEALQGGGGYGNGGVGGYGGYNPYAGADAGAEVDPLDESVYDPNEGVGDDEVALSSGRDGLNGWHKSGTNGRWFYYRNGVSIMHPHNSRPPIHLDGAGPGGWGASPSGDDDRISRLEKALEKLIDGGGKNTSLDNFLQAQAEREQRREEREETRRQDERDARREQISAEKEGRREEREREREKIEAEREARREQIVAEREREERRATAEREARADQRTREHESATSQARNSVEMMKIKADADKEISKNNAEILKAGSEASNRANERIIDVVMKKSDDVGLLTKGMQIAADLTGSKGTVAEVSQAARDIIPSLIDGAIAYKTATGGTPAGNAGNAGNGSSDDDMIGRFVGFLVDSFAHRADPAVMPGRLYAACRVAGFDVAKLEPLIAIGSPVAVAAFLDDAIGKAVDEGNKKKMLEAKTQLTSEQGKVWFQQVRSAYMAQKGGKAPAPQVATPPSAGQLPGPANPKA